MKDKFPSWRPFYPKFSQQRNVNAWLKKGENIAKRNSSVYLEFYSFLCFMPEIHSIPLLFRSILGIIYSLRIICGWE